MRNGGFLLFGGYAILFLNEKGGDEEALLKRAYIEITNSCNLRCSFCPGTRRAPQRMDIAAFDRVSEQLTGKVKYLYFHVMGEPLLHPELSALLRIAGEKGFRLCITTNGTLMDQVGDILLQEKALHKVSVSLHSFEGNDCPGELKSYLESVWDFAIRAAAQGVIVALRLWNLGGREEKNGEILDFLHQKTGKQAWEEKRTGSFSLAENLYLESAERFDWPDLSAPEAGTEYCLGLREQLAVLVDGTVVPCCLDHEGDIALGNLLTQDLDDILASPRARALYDGFSRREPSEELCRRCAYATRFTIG